MTAKKPAAKRPAAYRCVVGVDYQSSRDGSPQRAEAGDVVDDLPARSLAWLVEQRIVEPDEEGDE